VADGTPIVRTAAGEVQGLQLDGVASFRGIPYAEPPIGPLRFSEPRPIAPWDGVRLAVAQALAPPQVSGRGDPILGPLPVPGYDEDCLTLNVWTPSPGAEGVPVLIWIHGGGLMYHAGSASFYDGEVMARRGNIVVVTVNYRLGALGWLYLPAGTVGPEPVANLGLLDQCLALEWVQDNIAAFGGDPDSVTLAGQSAGGVSIVALAASPRGKGLFRRAILQSSGLQMPAKSIEAAERATASFLEASGVEPGDGDALRNLAVPDILAAQEQTIMRAAMSLGFDPLLRPMTMLPFRHVVDGTALPVDHTSAARDGSMDHLDLLLLVTSQEYRFVYAMQDQFWVQDRAALVARLSAAWGEQTASAMIDHYLSLDPQATPAEAYIDMLCREGSRASFELAEHCAAVGSPAYFAIFDWRSPGLGGRIGAAHTVELPFVFNNFEQWSTAPAVAGANPDQIRELGNAMQDAWVGFVATGAPPGDWPPYTPPDNLAMRFGANVSLVRDAGAGRLGLIDFMRTE
jgi:para-nitrobenzyl esterase